MELTHFDDSGRARMVDVGDKDVTQRWAVARGEVRMAQATLDRIRAGRIAKGDVLAVAQVAGIMAAKDASRLIPMCHPLLLDGVEMEFATVDAAEDKAVGAPLAGESAVLIEARVRTTGKTGAEMEALTAVAAAGLTIYDMCKAIDRSMVVGQIRLMEKAGGKSGHYVRPGEEGR